MSEDGQQEVVMLFNAEGQIQDEMMFGAFEELLDGETPLEGYAASSTRAAYCVVGNGLNLRGAVFFVVNVDEEGVVDPTFNLPLQYLVQNAGVGKDLGQGPVRMASRAQCSVPWQAVNLWEPDSEDGLEQIQKRLFRNKLKLKSSTTYRDEHFFTPLAEPFELFDNDVSEVLDAAENGQTESECEDLHIRQADDTQADKARLSSVPPTSEVPRTIEYGTKLNEVFGDAGKLSLQDMIRLHTQQLDQAKAKYRDEVEAQQTSYLHQLRSCRQEMHELKVALRQEQGRNRRLQQMLRGDIGSI